MADTNTYDSFQKVEKWTTREKFNALDLSTIETGTEYNLTGAIEEGELDSALQTKINGKLTAPTTPTAESAVTMLSDGTVGTKLLSEIGGGGSGGGKMYRHQIFFMVDAEGIPKFFIYIYNSDINTCTTWEKLWSEKYLNFNPLYESTRVMASLSHIPVSQSPGWKEDKALVGCSLYCRNYGETGEHFRLGIAGRYVSSDGVYSADIPIPPAYNTLPSGETEWTDDTEYTASTWATGDKKIVIRDNVTEL